jgi:hypothetical protein
MRAYDSPRMSIAFRDAKCTSPSSCRAGHPKLGQYSIPRSSPGTSGVWQE